MATPGPNKLSIAVLGLPSAGCDEALGVLDTYDRFLDLTGQAGTVRARFSGRSR